MLIQQLSTQYVPIRSTDSTATTFTAAAPAAAPPASGVLLLPGTPEGGAQNCGIIIQPYGTGADNATFNMKVYGWRRTVAQNRPGTTSLWVANLYGSFTGLTLSASLPGVAGTNLAATKLFVDAITQVYPVETGVTCQTISPGGDDPASIRMSLIGDQYLEIVFDLVTATAANALVARA